MASPYARPDLPAFTALEGRVQALGEELANWRRRCQRAEAELQEVKGKGGTVAGPELIQLRQRLLDLETENTDLLHRLDAARSRVEVLGTRLIFLEEREGSVAS